MSAGVLSGKPADREVLSDHSNGQPGSQQARQASRPAAVVDERLHSIGRSPEGRLQAPHPPIVDVHRVAPESGPDEYLTRRTSMSIGSSKDTYRPSGRKRVGRAAGRRWRERILPYPTPTPASKSCAERPYGFVWVPCLVSTTTALQDPGALGAELPILGRGFQPDVGPRFPTGGRSQARCPSITICASAV